MNKRKEKDLSPVECQERREFSLTLPLTFVLQCTLTTTSRGQHAKGSAPKGPEW